MNERHVVDNVAWLPKHAVWRLTIYAEDGYRLVDLYEPSRELASKAIWEAIEKHNHTHRTGGPRLIIDTEPYPN